MAKHIVIVGGGISGLSSLHYLKVKYANRPDIQIKLLEKGKCAGGTIQTIVRDGVIFEAGPNGFLSSRKEIYNLIQQLGIESTLCPANKQAKKKIHFSKKPAL